MKDPVLEKLVSMAPSHRVELPTENHWTFLEQQAGIAFPQDYKEFVSFFGTGTFGRSLEFYNPAARLPRFQLSNELFKSNAETLAYIEEQLKITFFPHPQGFVPIATMDRRDLLMGPDRQGHYSSLLWLDLDLDSITVLKETVASFIYKLYRNQLEANWCSEIRNAIWPNQSEPFFTPEYDLSI
jgi:hypothetical protein